MDKRKILVQVIKDYEKLKPFLTDKQKRYLDFEISVAKFNVNHPNTPFYIDQHLQPVKGILKSPRCKLCQKNLDEMRKNNLRCRVIDFCSENCRKEHNRRKIIRETITDSTGILLWEHKKDHQGNPLHLYRKDMFYFTRDRNELVKHYCKARKGKEFSIKE